MLNKNAIEKQLSQEKSKLELSVDSSNKAVERMSQNVEELQWRIRNNFDLPIQVSSLISCSILTTGVEGGRRGGQRRGSAEPEFSHNPSQPSQPWPAHVSHLF